MALIKCSECANQVSSMAKSCPHCGFPVSDIQQEEVQPPVIVEKVEVPTNQESDLAKKPMYFLFAGVCGVLAWWTGSYGYGVIGRGSCDFVQFNGPEVTSFERAFLCFDKNYGTVMKAMGQSLYPRATFSIVMIIISLGLWAITWDLVRKARSQP